MDTIPPRLNTPHEIVERQRSVTGYGPDDLRRLFRRSVTGISMLAAASCGGLEDRQQVKINNDFTVGIASATTGIFNHTESAALYTILSRKAVEDEMRMVWRKVLQEKAVTFEQLLSIPQMVDKLVLMDMNSVPPEGVTRINAYEIIARDSMAKAALLEVVGIVGNGAIAFLVAKALPGLSVNVDGVSSSEATGGDAKAIGKGGQGGDGGSAWATDQKYNWRHGK